MTVSLIIKSCDFVIIFNSVFLLKNIVFILKFNSINFNLIISRKGKNKRLNKKNAIK